jgi:hypothetical protein
MIEIHTTAEFIKLIIYLIYNLSLVTLNLSLKITHIA